MAEQDTKVQEQTTVDTTGQVGLPVSPEGSGVYVDPSTSFNSSFDNKTTKIKNKRNWYPEDGLNTSGAWTTGF